MAPSTPSDIEHASCIGLLERLAHRAPDGATWRSSGMVVALTGAPIPMFNAVIADGAPPDRPTVESVLDQALQRCPTPSLWIRRAIDTTMAEAAEGRGFRLVDAAPGMIADVDDVAPPPTDGLAISTGGEDALGAHLDLMVAAFGIPRSMLETFVTRDLLDDPDVVVAVGRRGDLPVTTAIGVLSHASVCVFNVATDPDQRGHGFGGAVTARVVEEGGRRGARHAALQSTEAGFGVYRRLGFRTVVDYDVWSA